MKPFELAVPFRLKGATLVRPAVLAGSSLGNSAPAPTAAVSGSGGYEAGFRAGYQEGLWKAELEGRRQRDEMQRQFSTRLAALDHVHEELTQMVQQHLPQLVLAAISRLMRNHRYSDEEIFQEISALLQELTQARRISIECCPTDLDALREKIAELGLLAGQAVVEWKPNPSLLTGEYILQSDLGSIDGRRIAKLNQIRLALEPGS